MHRAPRAAKTEAVRLIQGDDFDGHSADADSSDEEEKSSEEECHLEMEEDSEPSEAEPSDLNDRSTQRAFSDQCDILVSPSGQEWKRQPPSESGQRPTRNIIRTRPGVTSYAKARVHDELSAFKLIFDDAMVETIVAETNREGIRVSSDNWKTTSKAEVEAFLGLCILRGVYRGNMESLEELWSEENGRTIFRQTMPLYRFRQLQRNLRFDNKETRCARLARDKLAANRLLLDGFVHNSQACFFPNGHVTIDEQLYPFRGRCPHIQYIPSKPARYGLKFWILADSETSYCWNLIMYTGADPDRGDLQLGEHVVLQLVRDLKDSGVGVTTDNFFSSLRLVRKLLENRITFLGTIRPHRREVPHELRSYQGKQLFDSTFVYSADNQVQLVSYTAKKNKQVLVISSQHSSTAVDNSSKRKPIAILDYNKTKGGVDVMDQKVGSYSVKYKARRWHVAVFCNILDISCLNAFVIFTGVFPGWNAGKSHRRRLFLIALGKQLVSSNCLRERSTISRPIPHTNGTKRRCTSCPREKDRKTRSKCSKCCSSVCSDHSVTLCEACYCT